MNRRMELARAPLALCLMFSLAAFAAHAAGAESAAAAPREADTREGYRRCLKAAAANAAMMDCAAVEYRYQQQRLDSDYAELKRRLPKDAQARMQTRQREWAQGRERRCAPGEDGSLAALDAAMCRVDETALRAAELEARLAR